MSNHLYMGAQFPSKRLEALNWVLAEVKKSSTIVTGSLGHILEDKSGAGGSAEKSPASVSNLKLALAEMKRASGALDLTGQAVCAQIYQDLVQLFDCCLRSSYVVDDAVYKSVKFCCNTVNAYITGVSVGRTYSELSLASVAQAAAQLAGRQNFHPAQLTPVASVTPKALPNWALLGGLTPAVAPANFEKLLLRLFRGEKRAKQVFAWFFKQDGESERNPDNSYLLFFGACFLQVYAYDLFEVDIYAKRTAAKLAQWYIDRDLSDPERAALIGEIRYFIRRCEPAQIDRIFSATKVLEQPELTHLIGEAAAEQTSELWVFEPDLVSEVQRSLAIAKRSWSQITSGDHRAASDVMRSFVAMHRATEKLGPYLAGITKALELCVKQVIETKSSPTEEISLEVATALLFLESLLDDQNGLDLDVESKIETIRQRVDKARLGDPVAKLQGWMETLFHRSAERQSMGNVAGELRQISGEIERYFEKLFGQPGGAETTLILQKLSALLAQLKGVLGAIGLESAVLTVAHLHRQVVDWRPVSRSDPRWKETVDNVGENMATLGLMVDMLGYQPALANRLFRFDPSNNTLYMGVKTVDEPVASSGVDRDPAASTPVQETDRTEALAVDADLQNVFFQEAQEVVEEGMGHVSALAHDNKDIATLVSLRRGFHTLKGSARMVGLTELGEAAWVMEQLLNEQLTNEFEPISESLCALSKDALGVIRRWADFLARGQDPEWVAEPIRKSAEILRTDSAYFPIEMPPVQFQAAKVAELSETEMQAQQLNIAISVFEPEPSVEMVLSGEQLGDPSSGMSESVPLEAVVDDASATSSLSFSDNEFTIEDVPADSSLINQIQEQSPTSSAEETLLTASTSQPQTPADVVEAPAVEEPASALTSSEMGVEQESEQFKWIGPIKVRLNLYSVYLQEADELSRTLETRVDEWLLTRSTALAEEAAHTAHALAGCSATVGFSALSELCHDLEAVFGVAAAFGDEADACATPLKSGVDTVRHLLHQFAAGFLREPDPQLSQQLRYLLQQLPVAPTSYESEDDAVFSSQEDESQAQEVRLDEALVEPLQVPNSEILPDTRATLVQPVDEQVDPSIYALFADEAGELIPQIGHFLHLWLSPSGDEAGRQEVLRGLHTLKGSARIAGALYIGDRVHQLETLVEQADPSKREAVRELFDELDRIEQEIQRPIVEHGESAQQPVPQVAIPLPETAAATTVESSMGLLSGASLELPRAFTPLAVSENAAAPRILPIRINTRLLDTVMNRVGEVIGTRARVTDELNSVRGALTELDSNISRLRTQLRELEIQAESQMQSRMVFHKDADSPFDPLEMDRYTRVQELTRMMAESVNDVATVQLNLTRYLDAADDSLVEQGRQSKELQRELLYTRIVPFETLNPRLVRTARQAANDTGKLVQFEVSGGALEIDRQQLEKIGPSLEHLIRNAVAHGIELPTQRLEKGKLDTGRIDLSVHQDQNDIVIEMRDDGRGLNVQEIKNKAVALGLIAADADLDDRQAFDLICLPGFTTSSQVSELAGRGIGMDVVKSSVNASGGRLEGFSAAGQGLTVRMILPLTTATTQVLLVKHGESVTALPVNMVEQVLRFVQKDLAQAYNTRHITHAGELVPFYWTGALLNSSNRSAVQQFRSQPVVVVRSAGRRVAVHVDEIVGQREVLVRSVGEQLAHLPGLTGVSILPSGQVVLIYNPVALVLVYGNAIDSYGEDPAAAEQLGVGFVRPQSQSVGVGRVVAVERSVLVVDDSITVRKVSQRLLERAGYKVTLAADGLAALGLLRKELADSPPFLILADIEMPRMDGFEMIRALNGDEHLAQIPVIVITSRLAEKHREMAESLGVEHYLGKPFVEDQLLALVARYHDEPSLV